MSGDDPIHPTRRVTPSGYAMPVPGLTKREWLVGQLVSGPLMGQGAVPPIAAIWELADKILAAGEKAHAPSPPDPL